MGKLLKLTVTNFDEELKSCVAEQLGSKEVGQEFLTAYAEQHKDLFGEKFEPIFTLKEQSC